jgi:class 3 adenylate cyclase
MVVGAMAGTDRRLSLFGGLVGGIEVAVSDGTAVGPDGTDVLVCGPLGFTALTEADGDEQAADLVGGFCVAVRQLLAAHQDQEVKTIGDA